MPFIYEGHSHHHISKLPDTLMLHALLGLPRLPGSHNLQHHNRPLPDIVDVGNYGVRVLTYNMYVICQGCIEG